MKTTEKLITDIATAMQCSPEQIMGKKRIERVADAPRSDRAALVATHHERGLIDVVDLEFAEKLERELTAAKDEATKHISLYHQTSMKLETALFGKESDALPRVVERLKSELTECRSNLVRLKLGAARYEALRKLTATDFAELSSRNLRGEKFDKMVDKLIEKGK